MNSIEKVVIGLVFIPIAAGLFFSTSKIEVPQPSASAEAVAECQKVIGMDSGNPRVPRNRTAEMEQCLIQRDPAYASAVQDALCRQFRSSGAKSEEFSEGIQKRCF